MLVKGGADVAIKDSEGHVALDFDYKPPAVATLEGGDAATEVTVDGQAAAIAGSIQPEAT